MSHDLFRSQWKVIISNNSLEKLIYKKTSTKELAIEIKKERILAEKFTSSIT